jgi:hypothetical protein
MKTKPIKDSLLTLTFVIVSAISAFGQGTAFTYQGRLESGGSVANGLYEMSFELYDAAANGNVVGTPVNVAPVAVSNGLFTVLLDYGAAPFNGHDLNIFGSDMVPSTLHPRQPLTPAPYALHAYNAANLMSFTNAPLEIKIAGERVMRFELTSNTPHVIGGWKNNFVAEGLYGATIAGGGVDDGPNRVFGSGSTIGGGQEHTVRSSYSTIAGGQGNTIEREAHAAVISGGALNMILGEAAYSVIAGGIYNRVGSNSHSATITGGNNNRIESHHGIIGGGSGNGIAADASYSVVSGGYNNDVGATADYSFIGGGYDNNVANGSDGSVIAGGENNNIDPFSDFSVIGGGEANGIGAGSPTSVIGGGRENSIGTNSTFTVIGGGKGNYIAGNAENNVISGGYSNVISLRTDDSTIGGGHGNVIELSSGRATIGGGAHNRIGPTTDAVTIAGGAGNLVDDDSDGGAIGGGELNRILYNAGYSTVAGGLENDIRDRSEFSAIGGGYKNKLGSEAKYAVIAGGRENIVGFNASYAFAAGHRAHANHSGTFVWADSQNQNFTSTATNEFSVRATGGARFVSAIDVNGNPTAGVHLPPGGAAWIIMSDRNAKENVEPVNARAVLDKVAALPVSTWNYKSQSSEVRHIGPMAQDFKAAFGVGETETGITSVDADGVALAAIKGLNQKLEAELKNKEAQIKSLEHRLQRLEKILSH